MVETGRGGGGIACKSSMLLARWNENSFSLTVKGIRVHKL